MIRVHSGYEDAELGHVFDVVLVDSGQSVKVRSAHGRFPSWAFSDEAAKG